MRRVAVLTLAFAFALLLVSSQGAGVRTQAPKLAATVGPGFSITLRDAQGNRVTRLDPGTYDIEVRDLAEDHNFHLRGPGVNRFTSIEGTGTETWTVTLSEGTYTFVCDPHSTTMRGSFVVGNPPPPTTPPPSNVVTAKTRLVLTSGPRFTIGLRTAAGRKVTTMKVGTYTMVVRDRARIHNARVTAPGFRRATTLPFVGQQRWRVRLARPGTLRFLCDPHAGQGMRGTARIVR